MKHIIIVLIASLAVVSALYAADVLKKEEPVRLANEIVLPSDKAWHKSGELEVQLVLTSPEIPSYTRSLPVAIWFRNQSKTPATIRVCQHATFMPHGDIQVMGPDGKNVIRGACVKKHAMRNITIKPGEMRGFMCDAFNQLCARHSDGPLAKGDYDIAYKGAKTPFTVKDR
jgi:hypothetical protein